MRTGVTVGLLLFLSMAFVPAASQAQANGATAPPGASAAASQPARPVEPAPASDFSLMRTIGALGLVISLIVIGFWGARKYAPHLFNRRPGEHRMKVVETLPMGDKRSIALVQVDDSCFLVGNTSSQISLLARLPWEFSLGLEHGVTDAEPASAPGFRDSSRKLYEVEKRQPGSGKPRPIPPDVRAKMRQLREALEQ